ncbi:MAG: hypothetical protein HW412_665 [Bacteroidetes bacterium]|nr:hypothetical protein [Bacteroidota bacterium]
MQGGGYADLTWRGRSLLLTTQLVEGGYVASMMRFPVIAVAAIGLTAIDAHEISLWIHQRKDVDVDNSSQGDKICVCALPYFLRINGELELIAVQIHYHSRQSVIVNVKIAILIEQLELLAKNFRGDCSGYAH